MDIKDQDRFEAYHSLLKKGGGVPMGPSAPLSSAASRYFVGDIVVAASVLAMTYLLRPRMLVVFCFFWFIFFCFVK